MKTITKKKEQARCTSMLDELLEEFTSQLSKYVTSTLNIQKLFHILASLYSEEERYYHNLNHVQAMLLELKKHEDIVEDYFSVYLATWFHDAVYDSYSNNNEEKSAELAASELQKLKIPEEKIKFCCELILSTKSHVPSKDCTDCMLFLDLDLAILGQEKEIYQKYIQNVRKEYAWVPEDTFIKGRYHILNQFLSRERIFYTERFFQKYESKARKNIQEEISEIKKSSPLLVA